MRGSRPLIVVLLCCTLVLMRAFGVHVHLSHDEHVEDAGTQSEALAHHHAGASSVVLEHDEHHVQAHLEHGDVDVAAADEIPGKLASSLLVLAILAGVLLRLSLARTGLVSWPAAYRVPIRRRWHHLLPPSQAPPLAS